MTRTRTFDLLDAHFDRERHENYDSLPPKPRYKYSEETFVIDPGYWEKYYDELSKCSFHWKEFKFSSRPELSELIGNNHPGVYIFYIKPPNMIHGLPKFVLYVGISNEKNSNRPLKNRLSDYFRVKEIKKRDALNRLLSKYYEYTYIAYCTLNLSTDELKRIETNLIGFYYPIANKDDFPVEIATAKKAF